MNTAIKLPKAYSPAKVKIVGQQTGGSPGERQTDSRQSLRPKKSNVKFK